MHAWTAYVWPILALAVVAPLCVMLALHSSGVGYFTLVMSMTLFVIKVMTLRSLVLFTDETGEYVG